MDYSPPGSSVHGILQARVVERVAIYSSRGSSWPTDQTHIPCISCIGRWILYHELPVFSVCHFITQVDWWNQWNQHNQNAELFHDYYISAAMNNHVQDLCGHKLTFLEDKCPGVQLLGHMISMCSFFKETAKHFSTGVVPFNIPPARCERSSFSSSLSAFCIVAIFNFSCLSGYALIS